VTLLEREADPAIATVDAGEEALIKEARRLRRRRWIIGSTLAALVVGAGVGGFLVAFGPPSGALHGASNGSSAPGSSVVAAHALVPTRSPDLIQPTTLATLPSGNLLILDSSRDQILELNPDGHLSAFAGNGRLGFSGDGGQARDAELDFTYFSSAGMTVTPDGTVEVLDDGNCRIRAVNPDGVIRTILRVPRIRVYPSGRACPVTAFAVSPAGSIYIATNSEIERVSSGGHLVWVAGAHGSGAHERPYLTPSHVAFFPSALAFNNAGDLYIWNFSPKVIFQLTPTGKLTQLGVSYATQLTAGPNGTVLAGTHGGEVQEVTSGGVRPFYSVIPERVAGIDWGRDGGFQEDGIAVTKTGTIYVDNAQGNGYGAGTVLVRISPSKRAALAPIRTALAATLPKVGAPGFSAALYPPTRPSDGATLSSCPSDTGLERFTPIAMANARKIARTYLSSQFASDIAVTDRSWWIGDFNDFAGGGDLGRHTVTGERPTSQSPIAAGLAQACGPELVRDSIAVTIGKSAYSDFAGTLYFLDRDGHPLVYDVR
jgi:hypothetical protein